MSKPEPIVIKLDAVLADHQAKMPIEQMAFKHLVSIGTMLRIVNRLQQGGQRSQRTLDRVQDQRNDMIYNLARQGLSYEEIGQSLNPQLSRERVRQILDDMGERSHREIVHIRRSLIAKHAIPLIRQGIPRREIAQRLNQPLEDIVDLFSVVARGEADAIEGLAAAVKEGESRREKAIEVRRGTRTEVMERTAIALWRSPCTTTEMADRLKLNYLTIHHLVARKRMISQELAAKIAPLCGVDPQWFFCGEPVPAHIPANATWKSTERDSSRLVDQLSVEIAAWQERVRTIVPWLQKGNKSFKAQNQLLVGALRVTADIPPINWVRMHNGRVSPFHYIARLREIMNGPVDKLVPVGVRERRRPTNPDGPKPARASKPKAKPAAKRPKKTI